MDERLVVLLVVMAGVLPLAVSVPEYPDSTTRLDEVPDSASWEEKCRNVHRLGDVQECIGSMLSALNPANPEDALRIFVIFNQILQSMADTVASAGRCGEAGPSIKELCQVEEIIRDIASTMVEIKDTFKKLIRLPFEVMEYIVDKVTGYIDSVGDIISGIESFITDTIISPIENAANAVQSFFEGILQTIKRAFGLI